jgi:hypothetical protein
MKLLLALASLGFMGDVEPLEYNDEITAEKMFASLHVINVMREHFTPGRAVLLVLPGTSQGNTGDAVPSSLPEDGYTGTLDVLLQRVNDESRWPLRVLRPCSSENATSMTKIKLYLNYIILIRTEQNNSVKNLVNQMQYLEDSFLLNPRARFLLVINSCTPDKSSELAFRILNASWKFMIVDALLIIWCSCLNHNSAELLTSSKNVNVSLINVFTFFPYAIENNCSDVKRAVLVATTFLNDSADFVRNMNLFKERNIPNLHGCPVKVLTYHVPPAVLDVSKDGKPNCTGLEINVLFFILQHLNATVMYSIMPSIKQSPTAKISALIDGLAAGSADIALGALPLLLFLTENADATVSYFHTPIQWIVPCPKPLSRWGTIFNVFSFSAWLCLHIALFSVATVTYVLARYSEHPVYGSLQSCLLNIWAVALEISVPKMPRSFRVRFLFLLWVWGCFAFCITFQALFTTYLVNPRMERKIDTTDDLIASGIEYGYAEEYIDTIQDIEFRVNQRQCANIYGCLDNVIKHGNFATISSAFHTDYYRAKVSWHDRHLPVCTLKEDISALNAVMYLAKGHPLLRRIDDVIRTMVESGMMVKWTNDFLYTSRIHSRSVHGDGYSEESNEWNTEYFVFSLFHLQPAFCVLVVGYLLSTSALILELIYYKLEISHPEYKPARAHPVYKPARALPVYKPARTHSVYKPARYLHLDHFQRRLKNNQERFSRKVYLRKKQEGLDKYKKKPTLLQIDV